MDSLRLSTGVWGAATARPIPPAPHELIVPGRLFADVELAALHADGVLQRVYGSGYLPAGTAETAEHRALAMSLEIPAGLVHKVILGRFSAAWVYGCAAKPPRVTALLDHKRRAGSLPPFSALQIHEVTLGRFDVVQLARIRITSVLRTAVDLAFQRTPSSADWPDPAAVLWQISERRKLGCPLALVRNAVQSLPRVPHKNRALARISELMEHGPPPSGSGPG
ncbi:MAG: hypothetical protein L0G87_16725 [Renibacterium salmoninarum]|nr:hypothetical protein [Renibacterium salmoninarum]